PQPRRQSLLPDPRACLAKSLKKRSGPEDIQIGRIQMVFIEKRSPRFALAMPRLVDTNQSALVKCRGALRHRQLPAGPAKGPRQADEAEYGDNQPPRREKTQQGHPNERCPDQRNGDAPPAEARALALEHGGPCAMGGQSLLVSGTRVYGSSVGGTHACRSNG